MTSPGGEKNFPGNIEHNSAALVYDPDALAQRALSNGFLDLIHIPYRSVVRTIRQSDGMKDVPESDIKNVRSNYIKANELIIPAAQLTAYFDQYVLSEPTFFDNSSSFPEVIQTAEGNFHLPSTNPQRFEKAEIEDLETGMSKKINTSLRK